MPRPISPDTGAPELMIATDQHEYMELAAARYIDTELQTPILLTRWTFTDEERLAIAEGEDLFIGVLTFGHPMQPLQVMVGPGYYQLPTGDRT